MEVPRFEPVSDWTPTAVADLPSWRGAKHVAVDIETKDLLLRKMGPGVRRGAYIVGVSFAIEDGPAYYLPVRHAGGGNLDPDTVFRYLQDQATEFTGDVHGANLQYDLDHLAQERVWFGRARRIRDVQVADPLINELHFRYNLETIAERWAVAGKDEGHLTEAFDEFGIEDKSKLWQLHAKHVGGYAVRDSRLPLQLARIQERELDRQGLGAIYDIECRLLPALVQMRRQGVRVDFDQLERVEAMSLQKEELTLAEVKRLTGVDIGVGNVWKAGAVAMALQAAGIVIPLTEKTKKPSIKKDWLNVQQHPIAKLIIRARAANKVRTTFAKSIREHAIGDRIHSTFNQLKGASASDDDDEEDGAKYGRLSSCNPNFQQQPIRDEEFGKEWRAVFLPDEGARWAKLDLSTQEPRWIVHFAELTSCTGAREVAERFRREPLLDFHQFMADLAKIERDPAKTVFLGRCYGMGDGKLCRRVNLPTTWVYSYRRARNIEVAGPEGKHLIEKFNQGVPFLSKLSEKTEKHAAIHGYVRTAGGRKCRFPKITLPNGAGIRYEWTHKSLNRVIQGTSGDQVKIALVRAYEAGFRIPLQVHDELDFSLESDKQYRDVAEIMLDALPCRVPHVVGVEIGDTWGSVKKTEKLVGKFSL